MFQRILLASLLVLGLSVASVTGCTRTCPDSPTTQDPPTQATRIPLDTDQKAMINSAETQNRLNGLGELSLEDLSNVKEPVVSLTPQQESTIRRDFPEYFRECKLNTFTNFDNSQLQSTQSTPPSCNPPLPPLDVRLTKGNTTSIRKRDTSTDSICAFYQVYSTPIFGITSDGVLVQLVQMDGMLQVIVEEICRDNSIIIGNIVIQCCERQRTEDVLVINLVTGAIEVLEIQTACCTAMF